MGNTSPYVNHWLWVTPFPPKAACSKAPRSKPPPRVSSDVAPLGSGPRGWNCPVRPAGDRSGADRLVPSWYLESSPTSGFLWLETSQKVWIQVPKEFKHFWTTKLASWNIISTNGKDKVFGVLILWHMGMSQSQKQSKAWYPSVPLSLGITT
jgi:hypothetical protein